MADFKIRHIATSTNGIRIAIAEFEHKVYIWDLQSREKVSEFQTILDFGGERLAISEDGSLCSAGAYNIHGIAIYSTSNGRLIWQRKDLKKVQRLQFSRHYKDGLLAFFDAKPCHVLDIRNGETLETIRSLRDIRESPFAKIQLLDKKQGLDISNFEKLRRIAKIPRLTFAILDGVFTEDAIVISESSGPVSAYSIYNGMLIWQYVPEKGHHVSRLAYCTETGEILGVDWPYEKGGERTLLSFHKESGTLGNKFLIENYPAEAEFALGGTCLITSNGKVINTLNGNIILNLF